MLADGSVAACRRFPTIIGKMRSKKWEDVFLGNDLLKQFRRAENYETCGKCMFYKSCEVVLQLRMDILKIH
ncbi:MAG: SPASM domain-containing protein [Mediterraneibacter faecis]